MISMHVTAKDLFAKSGVASSLVRGARAERVALSITGCMRVGRAKLAELPIGRFASVAEIVPTAVFLTSDESTYYTGQTLGPNGGEVML